jgi:lysyl-tRNA synthetase class 2
MTQSDFLRSIRQYFWQQNFVEIEIPYLNSSLPLEPNIYSFKTTWTHKNQDFLLPTSPEFALKKFLVKNKKNCFAISHCFRDLESSDPLHTPEFLMLEWYEVNKNLDDLKKTTQNFVSYFLPKTQFIDFSLPKNLPDNEPDFNQFFLNNIEQSLPKNKAVFITGYPDFLAPLAKSGQRFELYINSIEIANGCTENLDGKSIEKSFIKEQQYRKIHSLPLHPYSQDFVNITKYLPSCSGTGLGIDRLLSIINHVSR